jgi:molybdenum cofactor synthesis domain-containing protein
MQAWSFKRKTTTVAIEEAQGRVAARTVVSLNTLPNKLASGPDGIAVYFKDFEDGVPDTSKWKRGKQWEFCNTGVGMPKDFDTVIVIEQVTLDEKEHLVIHTAPKERGASTVAIGATLEKGALLVKAGEVLTPVLLSLLAMGGHTEIEIIKPPVVAFIPTGSELVEAGGKLPEGKNVESNAILAYTKFAQWGAKPLRYPIIPDEWNQIETLLEKAVKAADIVVINAGSSKGSDDFTCEILEEKKALLFHEVDQGPGRHTSFSLLEGTPVIGISGPPVGAEFTLDWFVKPLVDLYLGLPLDYPPTVRATITQDVPFRPRPVNVILRAVLTRNERGKFFVTPVAGGRPGGGSSHRPAEVDAGSVINVEPDEPFLRRCSTANAAITVTKDSDGFTAGDKVDVELRYPYTFPPASE